MQAQHVLGGLLDETPANHRNAEIIARLHPETLPVANSDVVTILHSVGHANVVVIDLRIWPGART